MSATEDLIALELLADKSHGFPAGTMQALGQTESSNGTNLGTIGNTFQILPSTAANPGFGLGPLDGNNPSSAADYLQALEKQTGSLNSAVAAYHGGINNPTPYASGSPMDQFLKGIGSSESGQSLYSWLTNILSPTSAYLGVGGATPATTKDLSGAFTFGSEFFFRLAAGIVALMLFVIGLAALALKTNVKSAALTIAGQR